MAHQIDMSNGRANIAFTGKRQKIWHGLGQELTPGMPIEVWMEEAGMNWNALPAKITYTPSGEYGSTNGPTFVYPERRVLFRSDTLSALSIVSNDFKIVQPREVLEFFRDLTEVHGMVLSTAGCLFGGRRFWALAETNLQDEVITGDTIKGYLLFITSVDGTLASRAKFVSERVVCNNTLTIALGEKSKKVVKKTHRTVWDSKQAKIDLGLLSESWEKFMDNMRLLSNREMSDMEVEIFLQSTFFDKNKTDEDQKWGACRKVSDLMELYRNGAGSEYSYGTAYGVLNSVTEYFTHGRSKKNKKPDNIFMKGYYENDNIKNDVLNDLLAIA